MKRIILFLSMTLFLASCSSGNKNENVVKVGYIGESDRVIWQEVMRQVSNDNIKIELVSFGDYLLPNQALIASGNTINAKPIPPLPATSATAFPCE